MGIKPRFIIAFIFLSSIKFNTLASPTDSTKSKTSWINDFNELRIALYQNNHKFIKKYFTFPIIDSSSQIWITVVPEDEVDGVYESKKIVPFTEKDFDHYFNKLFSKRFINGLLKIKSNILYSTGEASSPIFKESDTLSYAVHAYFDKKTNLLSINFAFNRVYKDETGEVLDGGESSVIYFFTITKDGRLSFQEIMLAG
jgi:hypothetical protein